MAERFHLGTENHKDGTMWYTLVFESPFGYHVEVYNDTIQPFIKDRLRTIKRNELGKYHLNGAALNKVVEDKMKEMSNLPNGHHSNGNVLKSAGLNMGAPGQTA